MAVFLRIRTICFTFLSFKTIRNTKSCERPKSCEEISCEQLFGNSEPLKKNKASRRSIPARLPRYGLSADYI
jgi:hypothetical protein